MDKIVSIQFRVTKREEVEVKASGVPGMTPRQKEGKWCWDRYFTRWPAQSHVHLPGYLEKPPTPILRVFESRDFGVRGYYRIVQDGEKWFIELLEEVPAEVLTPA